MRKKNGIRRMSPWVGARDVALDGWAATLRFAVVSVVLHMPWALIVIFVDHEWVGSLLASAQSC